MIRRPPRSTLFPTRRSSDLLDPNRHVIRINQVGYLPALPKVAVLCSLDPARVSEFTVETTDGRRVLGPLAAAAAPADRKSTRLNSSHSQISYAVFCLKKKKI